MGRKNNYETHVKPFLNEIEEWYELLTEEQITKKLGVSVSAFEKYKREHAELRECLRKGKRHLVEELKGTLKKKAKGFYYEETKTHVRRYGDKEIQSIEKIKKYAQPDTGAIHLLLKNLDPEWRNDDATTVEMKQKQLEIAEKKATADDWD